MAKEKKQTRKRTTEKRVQSEDEKPLQLPVVDVHAEPEDEPWGKSGLTLKQRRFVKAYVGTAAGNSTKAAEMAGYNAANRNALRVTAHGVLMKPNVQRAIARQLNRRGGGKAETRAGIVELARVNMADFAAVDEAGNVKLDLRRAYEGAAMGSVKKIIVRPTPEGQQVTIETYNRLEALQTLAKIHGTLKDNHEHHVSGNLDLRNLTETELEQLESILLAAHQRAGIPTVSDDPIRN
jgi:phage terminase small subunit